MSAIIVPTDPGLYELIEQQELMAITPTVSFLAIPDSFQDLHIIASLRTDQAAPRTGIFVRFNSDNGNNYDRGTAYSHSVNTFLATELIAAPPSNAMHCNGAAAFPNSFSRAEMIIKDYARVDRNKVCFCECEGIGGGVPGDYRLFSHSYHWNSLAALSQIDLYTAGANFIVGCIFKLFGKRL